MIMMHNKVTSYNLSLALVFPKTQRHINKRPLHCSSGQVYLKPSSISGQGQAIVKNLALIYLSNYLI